MIASRYSAVQQRIYALGMLGILVCATVLNVQATDYQRKITWQATGRTFHIDEAGTITQPTFANARHMDQYDLLPYYSELLPATAEGEVSAQIVNAVYSAADGVDKNSTKYITTNITVEAGMSYYKKRPRIYVSFLPLRKNPTTGVIEKLESYVLRVNVTAKPQLRGGTVYKANSVLASGTWYKVSTDTNGIFKIDYNFIKNTIGIDPSSINLSTLAIFSNGGGMVPDLISTPRPDDLTENPTMLVDNNGNGKFDQGDYLLFYAQSAHAWLYDSIKERFYHQENLYTKQTYYFLTTDAGTGKRVPLSTPGVSPNKTITLFDDRAFCEQDLVNPLQSGKYWMGQEVTGFNPTASFSYSFPNLVTATPVNFYSVFVANNSSSNSLVPVSINGTTVVTHNIPIDNQSEGYADAYEYSSDLPQSYTANSDQLNIIYTFKPNADNGTSVGYLYYFEINLQRNLTMTGNQMPFRSIASIGASNVSNFQLNSANANTLVWDITNLGSIQQMQGTLNNAVFSFTTPTPTLKEFIAFNSNATISNPTYVGPVENQNLHAIGQPKMIIVTYDDFVAPSNDLADFHRTYDNLTVSVVKTSQIFNEFGSGKPDISAIRDFVEMVYNRAGTDTTKMPQYLLLMGDGSFDPMNRIPDNGNFISTYQSYNSNGPLFSYVADDFFGLLDPGDGGDIAYNGIQLLDIGVGRIPADAESDAWDVVNKIKTYKRPQPCVNCVSISADNSWRNDLTFVGGSGVTGNVDEGPLFITSSDGLAEGTRASYPVYNYDKIYTTAYQKESSPAGDRYPAVNTAILNKLNTGTLIMNYVGHGGPSNWAQERIFNLSDIIQLQNLQELPLFITATCDFGAYDLPTRTAGEWLLMNAKGGGIAMLTTVRTVFSDANDALDKAIFKYLFALYQSRYPRLGDAIMLSKNYCMSSGVDPTNTRKFTLLGDPALQLDYPEYNVVTTQINGKSVSQPHDTLKALTHITISGEVRDNTGVKMNSFNGTIYPSVYDKISTLSTLLADAPSSPVTRFLEYNSVIFKGKASVTGGSFSFSFVVPKDINYQYGNGRISYYADNGNFVDAHGYNTDIIIGGSSDTASAIHAGPTMKLYMNDANFVSGGITNANPVLLVNLQDAGGINTVGNGIGHDLTAILDNNNQNPIVLNDYYQTTLDNFQQGSVKYPFTNLAPGPHTIQVKAWDIYNNSTVGYIEFNVTINTQLALNHVYNYPNPFTTHTQFMFEHNRPFDNLDVSVQIFNMSGRVVKSIVQQVQTSGYRVDNITWDGLDDYGDPIGKGVYVYKLTVRDSNGNTANKFEKLVVFR